MARVIEARAANGPHLRKPRKIPAAHSGEVFFLGRGLIFPIFPFGDRPRICEGGRAELTDPKIHAQYDWTTGVPDNGNEWRKFRAAPRLYPLRPLFCTLLIGVETEGLLDYQDRRGIISVVRWNLRPVI